MDLAKAASVGVATVRRLEAARDEVRGSADTLWKIQKALEDAGVQFLASDESGGQGSGLNLAKEVISARGERERFGSNVVVGTARIPLKPPA